MSGALGPRFAAFVDAADAGEDLELHPDFSALMRAAQGKPSQEIGNTVVEAQPPAWREVEAQALELTERSRDLRVLALLAAAALHTRGIEGFAGAVGLIRQLLESHWEQLHPKLDPEDDNDPTPRANAVLGIADPGRVLLPMRAIPLAASPRAGRLAWRDIAATLGLGDVEAGAEKSTEATIAGVFRETKPEALQSLRDAVASLTRDLPAIGAAFDERAGYGNGPDLGRLERQVKDIRQALDRFAAAEVAEEPAAHIPPEPFESGPAPVTTAPRPAGGGGGSALTLREVATRAEATHLLDLVCAYYERHEPSSPLPLLLRRAIRLADKSFLEILRDIAPDGLNQAQHLGGPDF